MTTPLKILLADDQVPWDTNAENERVKAEIRREFAIVKPHLDVDKAFADDFAWFTGLLKYLEQTKGETVIRAPTFGVAKERIENPRGLDVAIVDLSWWGDHTLPQTQPQGTAHRHNQGLKLLPAAGDGNRSNVPIICLSQNFSDDFELMSTVYERGALPVPKNYQDRQLGYRALYGAVQYLTRERRRGGSKVEVFVSHAHEDEDLAQRLVTAIELGLQVPSDAIRCTSVPGYDFTPGTNFVEALKDELTGASCVVGLWTPRSMKSQWCLFELGAAWGLARKALFLSLGADALRDPPAGFRSIQASRLSDSEQLRRFLDELTRITGWPTKNRPAAESRLEDLARFAKGAVGR
jgi:TIR domain